MNLEGQWREMSDRDLADAASHLADYTAEAQDVIRSELRRRNVSEASVRDGATTLHPDSPYATSGLHYGPRVILPRRIKADVLDAAIGATILLLPLLVAQAVSDYLPDILLRLSLLSIPAGVLYSILRDTVGQGTSLGKRALGLRIIRLEDGAPCTPARVWARNVLDPVPFLDLVDFVWMCVDRHGQKLMDRRLNTQVVEASAVLTGRP